MATPTMTASWNDFYKDESLTPGTLTYELTKSPFNTLSDQLTSTFKNVAKFHKVIEESDGTNFIIIPTTDKQVQVIHSLFTTVSPSEKGNKMTLGIQGLSPISTFLHINEKDITKPLGRLKATKVPEESTKGSVFVPSPSDFATITSAAEFRKLIGTQCAQKGSRLDKIPNFTFFHPFLLIRVFHGQFMGASQLGSQIIETCLNGYGDADDPPDKHGVTHGLRHCYDLLLFLWAVEKGLAKPVNLTPFLQSDSTEKICLARISDLHEWKMLKEMKAAGVDEEGDKKELERITREGTPPGETRSSEDSSNPTESPAKEPRRSPRKESSRKRSRSRSEDKRRHEEKESDSSHSSSQESSDTKRKKKRDKRGKPKPKHDDPESEVETTCPPKVIKKRVRIKPKEQRNSDTESDSRRSPSPKRYSRRDSSPPPRKRSRLHRHDRSPRRIRGGEGARSPSPQRYQPRRRRNRDQRRRNRDRNDDYYDDSSSSSSSESRRGRGGGGGRRGDDRDPYRNRRRSPSSSDDESRGGRRHRPDRRDRRRRRQDDRRDRRNRRDRSDSRDRGRRRDHRGGRRRGHSHSPELDSRELLASLTTAFQESSLKNDQKKSMLANLHSEATDHFKYLSAKSYEERGVKLNPFTEKLMEDRNMNKALGYITSATKDWAGQVSRKGLVEFMTQGYEATDINKGPGGFTVFMFSPRAYRQDQSEEEKRSAMKAAFGDTKIDDEMIKKYTKVDRFIAHNTYKAEVQLEACVCFLEMLGAVDGIASEGYLTGLRYFRDHRATFDELLEADPLLLVKYFFMLDRIFQKFLRALSRYYHDRHPLRAARRELEGSMKDEVLHMMRGFELGSIPTLVLPRSLQAQPPPQRNPLGDLGKGGGGGGGRVKGKDNDKDGASNPRGKENPPWWSKNPNIQSEWMLPKGKEYKDFFSSVVKAHEGNIQGWPKLPHHRTENKKKPMCIRYQCVGACRESCLMAHVDPKDIPKEECVVITNKFKKTFGNYKKPTFVPQDSPPQKVETRILSPKAKETTIPGKRTHGLVPCDNDEVIDEALLSETESRENRRVPRPRKRRVPRPQEKRVPRPVRETSIDEIRIRRKARETEDYSSSEDSDQDTLEGLESPQDMPKKQVRALGRNVNRIRKANERDKKTLSKYLPSEIGEVFDEKVWGADDEFAPPKWLMEAVEEVASLPTPNPTKPPVKFDTSPMALDHNTELLREFDFDFEKFLAAQGGSTLDYGSEFRPVEQMEKVLGNHPNFPFFKDIIENGMQYHFHNPLSEEERQKELEEQIARGNHKSAQDESEVARQLLHKDVNHGFALPIHADCVTKIKGAMVEPCGVANQFKLQSDGSRKLAARLTHDLSYSITKEDASVNSRIDMDQYVDMIYGWCLTRVIHFIVALRIKYPGKRIFIAKYDYSDAYRRVAHAASAAVQTILIIGNIAYIMLRLAFGGSPNPPTWCAFSEMVTDLSNEIELCEDWDPKRLHSPAQKETPIPRPLDDSVPFAEGRPLAVEIPIGCTARTDSFIDDLIRIFLDTARNRERSPHAVPLAIHVTSRPHSGDEEPIHRRGLLSASKLEAEGLPVEIQVVLGWDLDTRRLLVLLPSDKFIAWSCDLEEVIRSKRVSFGDLDSLVGRLNHVAYLIPLARHFLHRFRNKLKSRRSKRHILTLSKEDIEDLLLWGDYLLKAREGISMNRITFRLPTRLGFGDSCPYGMGGYSFHGRGWRLKVPKTSPIYGVSVANNILEFLALCITLWVIIIECKEQGLKEECILILADSTSALGWLYKTRFIEKDSIYYTSANLIARKIARLVIHSTHNLASQHIKGKLNIVADLLSYSDTRDDAKPHPLASDAPDDEILTQRFHSHLSQFIPESFDICPLPAEVLSFATLVLQTLESSYIRNKKLRTKAKTECGDAGKDTATTWESTITPSSLVYPARKKNWSPGHSCPSTVELNGVTQESMLANVRNQWLQTLSEMPQAIWLRRFGTVSNRAPFTSKGARGYYSPSNH